LPDRLRSVGIPRLLELMQTTSASLQSSRRPSPLLAKPVPGSKWAGSAGALCCESWHALPKRKLASTHIRRSKSVASVSRTPASHARDSHGSGEAIELAMQTATGRASRPASIAMRPCCMPELSSKLSGEFLVPLHPSRWFLASTWAHA